MRHFTNKRLPRRDAFTLVEVVLAVGILGLAVVALLGMFGPTANNIRQVILTNEAINVTPRIYDFIEQSEEMGIDFDGDTLTNNFETMHDWVDVGAGNNRGALLAFTTLLAENSNTKVTHIGVADQDLADAIVASIQGTNYGTMTGSNLDDYVGYVPQGRVEGPVFRIEFEPTLAVGDVNGSGSITSADYDDYINNPDDNAVLPYTVNIYAVTPGSSPDWYKHQENHTTSVAVSEGELILSFVSAMNR